MREEQVRIYPGTRLVSSEEIERAWHSWHDPEAKEAFRERSEKDWEDEREEEHDRREVRQRHEEGRGEEEEEHERDTGRLFEIFDEMIFERRLSSDNLPSLRLVNRRCEAYGVPEFRTVAALLHEWREYLMVAARAREAEIREHRESHATEHAERHRPSEHPTVGHPPGGAPEPGSTGEHHGRREEPGDHRRDERSPRSRTTPRRPQG